MKKRSKPGGKTAKARPRKALKLKGRNGPKPARNPRSAANDPEPEVAQLKRELREALELQTATSEVLQVISSSPGDLEPVFANMLEKAVRICDATFGNIYRWDGDALQLVATHNTPPAYAEHRRHSPFRANQDNAVARMIKSKAVVHVFDVAASEAYTQRRDPTVVAAVELGRIRSALVVPMLKDEELVGAFIVSRQEVRPFTDKQIALVTNFAAQAVIAIENARLLGELRQRTGELERSYELVRQQATQLETQAQQLEQRVTKQVGEIERMGRLRRRNAANCGLARQTWDVRVRGSFC